MTAADRPGTVCLLSPFPAFGAAEDYLSILAEELVHAGWRVSVLAHGDLPVPPAGFRGTRLLRLSERELRSVGAVRRAVRRAQADLLHVNQVFLPGILAGDRGAVVVTAHTPALGVRYGPRGRLRYRAARARASAWIALSERNRDLLAAAGVRGDRISVIPPGLPAARFADLASRDVARDALGIGDGETVIGTVGRLSKQKRHDVLIRAVASLARSEPNLRLVIVGDGELRAETERLAGELLPGRATLTGHRDDVVRVLPAFDVFCLSSDFEGLPFALMEAMAVGLPVVTTDVQGSGEAVRDGRDGLVVPPGDDGALCGALTRMVRDRARAASMADSARARFRDRYTAPRMGGATRALYADVLRGRGSMRS